MGQTSVVFYQEDPNNVPVLKWLDRLPLKVQDKCRERLSGYATWHELADPRLIIFETVSMSYVSDLQHELSHSLLLLRANYRRVVSRFSEGA